MRISYWSSDVCSSDLGHRLVVKFNADKKTYSVRDTSKASIEVRTPNGKPAVGADVAFVAVDEALLQLAPNESWKLLDAMMGQRTLDVLTSTAQMQVVGKRHYGRTAVEPGGGGRSEERGGGEERVSTFRSRRSPYH